MRTIYKYPIAGGYEFRVTATEDATPIFAGHDPKRIPCVWVELSTSNEPADLLFTIVGTGNPIPVGAKYVGSIVDGDFVWHVYFERR